MRVDNDKWNPATRNKLGIDCGPLGDGRVTVGRNHEDIDSPQDAVYINIDRLGVSPDEAREIAAALLRVAADFEQMVRVSEPKNSDIIKDLPAGSVFRVITEGREEQLSWFVGAGGRVHMSVGTDPYQEPDFFDCCNWEIVVKYRND